MTTDQQRFSIVARPDGKAFGIRARSGETTGLFFAQRELAQKLAERFGQEELAAEHLADAARDYILEHLFWPQGGRGALLFFLEEEERSSSPRGPADRF